jgi:hypothetical protein
MPAPSSYSESSLAALMVNELGAVGVSLGLTTSAALITQGVTAVERVLGVSDVATATDMALVESAARWQAWLAAEAAAVNQYDVKAGTSSLTRGQTFEHIRARLDSTYGFYLIEKARVAAATGAGVFAFAAIPGRRGR